MYLGRRKDPEVQIEVPYDEDVFSRTVAMVALKSSERNKVIYRLHSNEKLDECIGLKWNKRFRNKNGNVAFCCSRNCKILCRVPSMADTGCSVIGFARLATVK